LFRQACVSLIAPQSTIDASIDVRKRSSSHTSSAPLNEPTSQTREGDEDLVFGAVADTMKLSAKERLRSTMERASSIPSNIVQSHAEALELIKQARESMRDSQGGHKNTSMKWDLEEDDDKPVKVTRDCFFHIPAVRFSLRLVGYICLLMVYFVVLLGIGNFTEISVVSNASVPQVAHFDLPGSTLPPLQQREILLALWIIADAIDLVGLRRFCQTERLNDERRAAIDTMLMTTFLMGVAMLMRAVSLIEIPGLTSQANVTSYGWYQLVLSGTSVLVCFRALEFFWPSRVGTLVIVVRRVLQTDLIDFMQVFERLWPGYITCPICKPANGVGTRCCASG
jgi:hypothetical protein